MRGAECYMAFHAEGKHLLVTLDEIMSVEVIVAPIDALNAGNDVRW